MKITFPTEKFIEPIMRAFESMESKTPDKNVIALGHHTLWVLSESLNEIYPELIERETSAIEKDCKMLFDVLKSVRREIDNAGDKALDILSPEVIGDVRHTIDKIERESK
jgi:DNA anti-recombination protein RmuC